MFIRIPLFNERTKKRKADPNDEIYVGIKPDTPPPKCNAGGNEEE
jgi:hypothetical protein